MFDGEDAVVVVFAEHGDEGFPELVAVAVADGAEGPASAGEVAVGAGVEVAVVGAFVGVELGVLGVDVVEQPRLAECAGGEDGVDPLPEEVRGVEVGAQWPPAPGGSLDVGLLGGLFAEADDGVGVVDAEAGVGLPADLHAVLAAELGLLGPVGHEHLVPLVGEDLLEIRRPGAGDPVGGAVGLRAARAAGEGDDDVGAELGGEFDGGGEGVVVLPGLGLLRVDGVAVHGEAGEFEVAVVELGFDFVLLFFGTEDLLGIEEWCSRVAADGDLDAVEADVGAVVECVVEFHAGEECGHHAEFHGEFSAGGRDVGRLSV